MKCNNKKKCRCKIHLSLKRYDYIRFAVKCDELSHLLFLRLNWQAEGGVQRHGQRECWTWHMCLCARACINHVVASDKRSRLCGNNDLHLFISGNISPLQLDNPKTLERNAEKAQSQRLPSFTWHISSCHSENVHVNRARLKGRSVFRGLIGRFEV